MRRIVVVGAGNTDRGDDGVGRAVARHARTFVPDGVRVVEIVGGAWDLMDAFAGADAAIVVDAASSGEPAGTVRRFDASREALPVHTVSLTSHGAGVAEAIELARALGRLPDTVVVFAVEGSRFSPGADMSGAVAVAVAKVVSLVLTEIACLVDAPLARLPAMRGPG